MNTEVSVVGAVGLAPWFRAVEAALTRFDPESPLARLNRRGGRWTVVPPLLFYAVRAALGAAAATGGAFDPTVLDALEAAGYGRSFELGPTPPAPPVPAGRWRETRLLTAALAAYLPEGVRLDLGGIGKGLAVDGALARSGDTPRVLIDAGGDLGVRAAPGEEPAEIEVADPFRPAGTLVRFRLYEGGVATSSTLARRWGAGLHHIIDPGTGRPARSDLVAATVVAGRTAWAEALAKACIVLGRERGLALLSRHGCQGILVTERGDPVITAGLRRFVRAG